MAAEIWKPVKDFEGLYEVSNLGRVRSLPRKQSGRKETKGKILSSTIAKSGNRCIKLHCAEAELSMNFNIGRLVAETFIPNPYQSTKIRYKDGDKSNCAADNLEWCEPKPEASQSKCRYCGKPVRQDRATICANCHDKKEVVHRLWLICQEIKKATGQKVK